MIALVSLDIVCAIPEVDLEKEEDPDDMDLSDSSLKFNLLVEIVQNEKRKSDECFKSNSCRKDRAPVNRFKSSQDSYSSSSNGNGSCNHFGDSSASFAQKSSGHISGASRETFQVDEHIFDSWRSATNVAAAGISSKEVYSNVEPTEAASISRPRDGNDSGSFFCCNESQQHPEYVRERYATHKPAHDRSCCSRESARSQVHRIRRLVREQSWRNARNSHAQDHSFASLDCGNHSRPSRHTRDTSWPSNHSQIDTCCQRDRWDSKVIARSYSDTSKSYSRSVPTRHRRSCENYHETCSHTSSKVSSLSSSQHNRHESKQAEEIMVEIFPGTFLPLRGTKETIDAVTANFYAPVDCITCSATDLFAIADVQYFICPTCRTVASAGDADFNERPIRRRGLGLGFDMESLCSMQADIARASLPTKASSLYGEAVGNVLP